jgi:hypothetical protein
VAIDEVNEESETLANRIADPSGRKQPSCPDEEAGSSIFQGPQPTFPCHWMLQGVCQGDQPG